MKKREKIPPKIESQLLLANRHACCVCQNPHIQIHHIDENPNNNDLSNLAILCIEHHNFASMKGGMTKKLKPNEIKKYKRQWEEKCAVDISALARDRLNFYATAYKNPSRIREIFISLSEQKRKEAVDILANQIEEEEHDKTIDQGFKWQALPKKNVHTLLCLDSMRNGELWPSWLPRVQGHPLDPDYPIDKSPPNGMQAFHFYDLYCQLIVQVITIIHGSFPLEQVRELKDPNLMDAFSGNLITFRERAYGKNVRSSRSWEEQPVGRVRFRAKLDRTVYRTEMSIKNMYVFSDTAAEYMRNQKLCGVGILGGVTENDKSKPPEIKLQITPLLIGVGGFSVHNPKGYWNFR